jgi:hypothetical protein
MINPRDELKTVKKSHFHADSFFYNNVVKVNRDFITRGRVDGKRVYFLEQRDCFGQLEMSTTFTNIVVLKKCIRN